jgi:hypothetical protein
VGRPGIITLSLFIFLLAVGTAQADCTRDIEARIQSLKALNLDFKIGDYVRFGKSDQEVANGQVNLALPVAGQMGSSFTFVDGMLPGVAKLKGWDSKGNAIIEVSYIKALPKSQKTGKTVYGKVKVLAPRNNISYMATANRDGFFKKAAVFDDIGLEFAPGEKVRFRGSDGKMKVGTLGPAQWIKTARGKLKVQRKKLFKFLGGKPRTPEGYVVDVGKSDIPIASPMIQGYLNGAARVVSSPDYQKLEPFEQLRTLVQYVEGFVPYDSALRWAGDYKINSFAKNLCVGGGTCRHQATLLAEVLAETGYEVRLTGYFNPETGAGHRWLEVTVAGKKFVVDVAALPENRVLPFDQMLAQAQSAAQAGGDVAANSYPLQWYSQPDRKFYDEK